MQEKAIGKLMVVVKWLMFMSLSLLIFDIVGYFLIDPENGRII